MSSNFTLQRCDRLRIRVNAGGRIGGSDSDATLNCNDLWFPVFLFHDFKTLRGILIPRHFTTGVGLKQSQDSRSRRSSFAKGLCRPCVLLSVSVRLTRGFRV